MNRLLLILALVSFVLNDNGYAQKYDAEVLLESTVIDLTGGILDQQVTVIIQVNNRAGDSYTYFNLNYSKSDILSNIDAWIEDMNGNRVRKLEKSDITDRSAISDGSLYEDDFVKHFQLKHNVYPYKVICSYVTTSRKFMHIARWSPVYRTDIPTRKSSLKINIPKNILYKVLERNVMAGKVDSTSTHKVLSWSATYDTPLKYEIFAETDNPYVSVAPILFQYGVEGSNLNWISYGNWTYNLMLGLDELPEEEQLKITSLTKGITDKKEIVRILYHYMQDHVRYINVSIGTGGHKPYPAAYVARNKYGDCKALTNYMKAMLKYVGIPSIYALVYADDQPIKMDVDFASAQFNHVILAVPIGNDTIWLENTSNINPFGYLGTFTQNRYALLVIKDKSKLARIPSLQGDPNNKNMSFDIKENGLAQVNIKNSFRENNFESFNSLYSSYNDEDKDKQVRNYMPFANYEVINWDIKKLDRDTARIELHATLLLNKFLKPVGTDYYFSLNPSGIPKFTNPTNRTLPVALPYPFSTVDTLEYNLPKGFTLKTETAPVLIESPFGSFELEFTSVEGKIVATKKFKLLAGKYSLEQYPAFYRFLEDVKKADVSKIVIKKG